MGQKTVLESLSNGKSKRFLAMGIRRKVWCISHGKSTADSKQKIVVLQSSRIWER